MPPERESRPADHQAAQEFSTATENTDIVTRLAIDALLSTLNPFQRVPRWYTHPATETQFAAALLAHCPDITPVYDANDVLTHLQGIRLKKGDAA